MSLQGVDAAIRFITKGVEPIAVPLTWGKDECASIEMVRFCERSDAILSINGLARYQVDRRVAALLAKTLYYVSPNSSRPNKKI
jgi:hypothetical protein